VRASRHPIQVRARLSRIGGLPEHLPVQDDIRVASDRQSGGWRGVRGVEDALARSAPLTPRQDPPACSLGLAACIFDDEMFGVSPAQLLDPRNDDVELDPQLFEDLPPLGRARR
jgi:hypothetical protein